jgi:foldase protein PrsA
LVNGQAVSLDEYETQVSQAMAVLGPQQDLDPQTEEGKAAVVQLRRQILDAMIDLALIEQAAAQEGLSIPDEQVEQEMIRLVGDDSAQFEDWLKANGLNRDGFQVQLRRQMLSAALQEHVLGSEPPMVEQVHARHILVETEAEAIDLLLRLRAGEGFAALAKQYSQDNASGDSGGDLGFFPRNVMPLEIEAVAFGLSPGQMSGIVKTDFGYHIIEILEKDPAKQVPDEMMATWRQNSFLQWLRAQRSVAKIKYLIPLE